MTAISNPGAPDGRNSWEHKPANRAVLLREAAQTLREKAEGSDWPDEEYDLAVADWLESEVELREWEYDTTHALALAVACAVLRRVP